MPLMVNLAWDEQSIYVAHLVDRLFSWHQAPASPQPASWLSVLFRRRDDDAELSFTSLRALATAYFAKVHRQTDIMRKGARFYSRALSALRIQLQDPQLVLEDDILAAIICMGIYESVTFTQPNGWLHHYKGLARLVSISMVCIGAIPNSRFRLR